MFVEETVRAPRAARRLSVEFAQSTAAVREAQALRYRVFVEELGARVAAKLDGVDRDVYDDHCEHLLVRDNGSGDVVGTYRLLSADQARQTGGFYADQEFDLRRLTHVREHVVELGRACVDPAYRNGGTIALLWSGIAAYLQRHRYTYLMGCASVSLADGGLTAAQIYREVKTNYLAPAEWRVFPRCPLPGKLLSATTVSIKPPAIPPLIKGYLRAGGLVCGEPAWDADFNTADLFMLLPLTSLNPRHQARFMGIARV